MEIDVIYKYRAPEAALKTATTIATGTLELEAPVDVLNAAHPVGEVVALQIDNPEEEGEVTREYVVLDRFPMLTQIGHSGYTLSLLIVVVTDPD